jgi:hypothetical protein
MTEYSDFFNGMYNVSGFDGLVESDFLKLGVIPEGERSTQIDYALVSFDEYREALQNYLKSVYPLDYNNFAASDLGQMLLEMFAYLASVNTLRADMTANEMYLDTVQSRGNLNRLLKLIGVKMKGPTSSKCTGQLTLDTATTNDIIVEKASRTVQVTNNRDTSPLSYTVYKQLNDGTLDLYSEDLVLTESDQDTTGAYPNLFLLEGNLRTQTGKFSPLADRQIIRLTDSSIVEGSIGVRVGDDNYNEISNLFLASGGTQKVFEKRYLPNFATDLVFGDGVRGNKPSPNASYTVTYRTGGGARGNVSRGLINQSINVKEGTTSKNATLINTTKGSGGAEAESVAHAKRYAPYFFRTQYRAVTGEDYNVLANSFVGTAGSTAKAMAVLRNNGAAANVIDLYVLAKASDVQLERASLAFKRELLDYFNQYKMLTDEIVVSDGVVRTVDLVATVFIDADQQRHAESIKQAAAKKMVQYFNIDDRSFGQKLDIADLTNFMLTVPQVRFFKVDNVDSDINVNFNEVIQLNNFQLNIETV